MAEQRTTKREDALVCVAVVATAHGIRGALKLRTFTEEPRGAAAYGPVYDKQGRRLFELRVVSETPGGLIATAEGIEDRTEAERWRGVELYVPRSALPAIEAEDEFYIEDLRGLAVERRDGTRIGTVAGLENYGAGDVVEVALDGGGSMTLPFTRAAVPEVDLEGGRIVAEPPAELVPGGEEEEGGAPGRDERPEGVSR